MSQKRKIKLARYIVAGAFTLLIFCLGLLLGLLIENQRIDYIRQLSTQQKLDFSSLQTQYAYLDQLGAEKDCSKMVNTFDETINNLEKARLKLVSYSQNSQTNNADFDQLRREYMLDQIQYWLFSKKVNQLCSKDAASILYFYSTNDKCPDCGQEEFVLDYLKKRFGDRLLNFALDSDYTSEPMIQLLKANYNVTIYPTLVIEGQKLEGFISKDEILGEICKYIKKTGDCAQFVDRTNETMMSLNSTTNETLTNSSV